MFIQEKYFMFVFIFQSGITVLMRHQNVLLSLCSYKIINLNAPLLVPEERKGAIFMFIIKVNVNKNSLISEISLQKHQTLEVECVIVGL